MKKKIILFALLCVLLVGLVPPCSASANTEQKYNDITDFLVSNGYEPFAKKENVIYVARVINSYLAVHEIEIVNDTPVLVMKTDGKVIYVLSVDGSEAPIKTYLYNSPTYASETQSYGVVSEFTGKKTSYVMETDVQYRDVDVNIWEFTNTSATNFVYSDVNIYNVGSLSTSSNVVVNYDVIEVESSVPGYYTFMDWCVDAEVENPSGHSFNSDYMYLVTYNDIGYFVTQIYSDVEIETFTELVSYDNRIYLHLKDAIEGTIFAKRYEYAAGKWTFVGTDYYELDSSSLTDLGVSINANNKLCYSNRTIKTGSTYGNIYYEKNTEFTEGFSGEVDPDSRPDVTPTPVPSTSPGSGSGGNNSSGSGTGGVVGGQAKPGGILTFLISLITLVWTELFAVEVPVDGFQISFQQIVIWGAIVGILIWLGSKIFSKN